MTVVARSHPRNPSRRGFRMAAIVRAHTSQRECAISSFRVKWPINSNPASCKKIHNLKHPTLSSLSCHLSSSYILGRKWPRKKSSLNVQGFFFCLLPVPSTQKKKKSESCWFIREQDDTTMENSNNGSFDGSFLRMC